MQGEGGLTQHGLTRVATHRVVLRTFCRRTRRVAAHAVWPHALWGVPKKQNSLIRTKTPETGQDSQQPPPLLCRPLPPGLLSTRNPPSPAPREQCPCQNNMRRCFLGGWHRGRPHPHRYIDPRSRSVQDLYSMRCLRTFWCTLRVRLGGRQSGSATSCFCADPCTHSVQDLNRLTCLRTFWTRGSLVVLEDQGFSVFDIWGC